MSKIVRSSKYRHVFGTAAKKEHCYDNLKITRSAWDSNFIKASREYFAVIWESGGGGAVAVCPYSVQGKLNPTMPLITGHKAPVLDIDFNPFNDNLLATASEDTYVKIWSIPQGGLTKNIDEPAQTLVGHRRKVGSVQFNPVANNILCTSSGDPSVKIWDIEKGSASFSVEHGDLVLGTAWNYDGSQVTSTCKDKKLRVFDPRQVGAVAERDAHQGVKGFRAIFLGQKNKILTVGFSKSSEREYCIWDPANLSAPLAQAAIDTSAGMFMPFYDDDTSVLFLAGKGDGNIRYYEVVDDAPYMHYLSEYKSASPQRGMAAVPKLALDISSCEIMKLLKLSGSSLVEPISFTVPRKSDAFQDDIYPDTPGNEPALSADEWASGANSKPKLVSLALGFVAKPATTEFNPTVQKAEEGPKNEKELREEYEKQKTRIAYLESELAKKDQHIKDLEARLK